jgi:curli biogenesis system outer membrane secretion channel CsgG
MQNIVPYLNSVSLHSQTEHLSARFEVTRAIFIKTTTFSDVRPRSSVGAYKNKTKITSRVSLPIIRKFNRKPFSSFGSETCGLMDRCMTLSLRVHFM